ncbi:MAG: hypothetical protein ABSG09_07505 [Acidimicrobiales bacterium]|jgi:2-phospho-L-lactate guanylyltransferase
MADVSILIPVKDFGIAKERLRLGGVRDVTELAQDLLTGVINASAPRHVVVLTESNHVSDFARRLGVEVFHSDSTNLNDAAALAYQAIAKRFGVVMFVHGDLANPYGLGLFEPDPGITIVTDHHQRGTNVLVLPTGLDFHFSYGPHSRALHEREARRLGIACRVVLESPWALDIDEIGDLEMRPNSTRGGPEAPSNTRPRTD